MGLLTSPPDKGILSWKEKYETVGVIFKFQLRALDQITTGDLSDVLSTWLSIKMRSKVGKSMSSASFKTVF